jgi:hypothetical protein
MYGMEVAEHSRNGKIKGVYTRHPRKSIILLLTGSAAADDDAMIVVRKLPFGPRFGSASTPHGPLKV